MENSTQERKIERIVAQLIFENKELEKNKIFFYEKLDMIKYKLKENERYLREHCKHEWKCMDDGCMYEKPTKICKKCNIYK